MTTAHRSSVLPITPAMLAHLTPEVLAEVGKGVAAAQVNREYDVPGVANRSMDGKTLFLDRHLPAKMDAGKPFDPAETLVWHEIPEWVLMNAKVPYPEAHSLATEKFEKPKVLSLGLDWDKYQEAMGGEIAANEKLKATNLPPDIDKRPYEQEPDLKALKEASKPKGFRLTPIDFDPFAKAEAKA
jgi:hypothetical protein